MKYNNLLQEESQPHNWDWLADDEETYVGCGEVICDDDGVHYLCPVCKKYCDSDAEAFLHCL